MIIINECSYSTEDSTAEFDNEIKTEHHQTENLRVEGKEDTAHPRDVDCSVTKGIEIIDTDIDSEPKDVCHEFKEE